ncbi:MAG: hypothetical protein IPH44_11080 [Myxococcales bacterium]|nr:hypothetical protein [Myxococcales bacterium]MBK7196082.1 hypothetical protein [Myxococcales bacterium]MBP6844040.1 hypothetical protein [Kofleriaceae bacterium]
MPVEAAAAAVVVVGAVALASPDDVWLRGLGMHPAWLPVIVLAARYGPRGLFTSLAITWAGLTAASLALGGAALGLGGPGHRGADLVALIAATLAAWVGMMHEGRLARLAGRLADASELQRQAEATVQALHDSLAYLRTRHDRVDIALSLWRNLAGRIERGPAADAADAAIELCMIRTGARAGLIELRDGARVATLAWRGPWAASAARPHDIAGDRTVRAAVEARVVALGAADATDTDSAVAAPVFDHVTGALIGVVALRGVPARALRPADLRDLAVIGQWLAPALSRALAATGARRLTSDRSA